MSPLNKSLRSAFGITMFVVTALAGTYWSAAETRNVAPRVARVERAPHKVRALHQPAEEQRPGVLVAPGCPSCRQQTQPATLIDWVRAQLERFVA